MSALLTPMPTPIMPRVGATFVRDGRGWTVTALGREVEGAVPVHAVSADGTPRVFTAFV